MKSIIVMEYDHFRFQLQTLPFFYQYFKFLCQLENVNVVEIFYIIDFIIEKIEMIIYWIFIIINDILFVI